MIFNLSDKYLKKAQSDLKIAIGELRTENPAYDMICFHFQQFVEKCLKAFLIANNQNVARTHNIPFLLKECSKFDISFDKFIDSKLIDLNTCGVEIRYDDIDEVSQEFIESVYPLVLDFKCFIDSKISTPNLFSVK